MIRRLALVLLLAPLATAGYCGKVTINNQIPTAPTPTPPAPVADTIEFRVFGSVGDVPIAIRYTDSTNGLTNLTTISLPYVASIKNLATSIFVDLEARATPPALLVATSSLQVQIVINGKVFREAFASGITPLAVIANGTFRRGE